MAIDSHPHDRYVLARGEEARYRLGLVNEVHFPDTEQLLRRAGLAPGLHVADVGCGIGLVTAWIAGEVGESGSVTVVDIGPEQVAQTEETSRLAGRNNVRAVIASATDTGLPPATFDLAWARFLLMHLPHPEAALAEVYRILKPGAVLAVEDGDFTSPFCSPAHPAFERCFALYRALGVRRGLHFDIGPKLYRLALQTGFVVEEVRLVQPVVLDGDAKRLPEWTLTETVPALVEAGLATAEEIARVASEMEMLAADETVLFAMVQCTQVIARKPALD